MVEHVNKYTDLLIRFAQYRCPVSKAEPQGGSKIRSAFYLKCYLYRTRFGTEPLEDMMVVIWAQAQND